MGQSQAVVSKKRALVAKPAFAVVPKGDGHARSFEPGVDQSRLARIREAAYGLYVARGHVDGHDLDDWLAAEASLAGQANPSVQGRSGNAAK